MDKGREGDALSKTFRDGKNSEASQGSLMDKEHEYGDVHEADKNMVD